MPELLTSEQGHPVHEARQHAIVLLTRRPRRHWTVVVVVLTVLMLIWPHSWLLAWLATCGVLATMRYRLWRAERIVLTHKRIIHVYGVLETTREEAWLRLDRISGLRLKETAWGRLLGYATVHVEAPGEHPGLKRLFRIRRGGAFYRRLRTLVLEGPSGLDPDGGAGGPGGPVGPFPPHLPHDPYGPHYPYGPDDAVGPHAPYPPDEPFDQERPYGGTPTMPTRPVPPHAPHAPHAPRAPHLQGPAPDPGDYITDRLPPVEPRGRRR